MKNAKDYFLSEYLPTTSDKERELWFRTNEMAIAFVEIMKSYAKEVVEECDRCTLWSNDVTKISNEINKISNQI